MIMQADADVFLLGYLVCALWASTDEEGNPLDDRFSIEDISKAGVVSARGDCEDFMLSNEADLIEYAEKLGWESAGHDFWLTRNGHGAGFWDRGLGALGERLAAAARVYGSCDLYITDDDKLYLQ